MKLKRFDKYAQIELMRIIGPWFEFQGDQKFHFDPQFKYLHIDPLLKPEKEIN